MKLATNYDLRPYGYRPGKLRLYCAACNSEQDGMGAGGFKCFRCAVKQYREVEKTLRSLGDEIPANDLPEPKAWGGALGGGEEYVSPFGAVAVVPVRFPAA